MLKSSQHNTRPKSRQRPDFAHTEVPSKVRHDEDSLNNDGSTPRLAGVHAASPKRETRNTHGLYQHRRSEQIAALKSPGLKTVEPRIESAAATSHPISIKRKKYKKKMELTR